MRSRAWWLRALAPPALVAAVISSVALTNGASADVAPSLSPKTADQLLAMIQKADVAGLQGTVVEKSALGLPALPDSVTAGSATGVVGMMTGTHRLRVWVGGAADQGKFRAQILDQLDETELVASGDALWSYTYSTNQATELKLRASSDATPAPSSPARPPTPDQTAKSLLSAVGNTTSVTAGGTSTVAGRDAYVLDVEPLTSQTTIGRISVDIDASTGVPLRVRVFARGSSSPALSIGFSSVSFGPVAPSVFTFTPPPGAQVSVSKVSLPTGVGTGDAHLIGTGWASVLVVPDASAHLAGEHAGSPRQRQSLSSLLDRIGQPVSGGTLISTRLVNVLLTYDGRLLIGAVPASTLQTLAKSAPTK
jgi:outer membrane lipoprotein-sorting protein